MLFTNLSHNPLRLVALAIASACWLSHSSLAAEIAPGAQAPVTFQAGGKQVVINFRFCPRGQLVAGEPQPPQVVAEGASPAEASAGNSVAMDPFYLMETEVTMRQFADLVPAEVLERLKDRAKKLTGAKEDVALLNSPDEHPIFMVSPADAVAFCAALNQLQAREAAGGTLSIESRVFRLPSHLEWQYACRAQATAEGAKAFPHFNSWTTFDSLDRAVRGMCQEEWKEIHGDNAAEFTGSQEQVAEILKKRDIKSNPKPLQILSAFLEASTGLKRDYSEAKPGKLNPVHETQANAWGFTDMHENVCEWTVTMPDRDSMQKFWQTMTAGEMPESSQKEKAFILAGGMYNSIIGAGSDGMATWQPFTIWGGSPYAGGSAQAFSLQENDEKDFVSEYFPGMRIVMERAIASDWLVLVRKQVIPPEASKTADAFLASCRTTIAETAPLSRQPEMNSALDFYSSLVAYRQERYAETAKSLRIASAAMPGKKKSVALSLGSFSAASLRDAAKEPEKPAVDSPAETATAPSEDQIFLNQLAELVELDGQSLPNAQ